MTAHEMTGIDLRSDTVTWPTTSMRQAMAEAEVGDDVKGEDPTVNRLQVEAARRLGKEAGLFVASGTMGNLVSVLSHCTRGDEVILGARSHIFLHEAGGVSVLGGVHSAQVPVQPDGTLALPDIEAAIRDADDPHSPLTRLIALENTQGDLGGLPLGKPYIDAVGRLARAHDLKLHIDGARLFNAATAVNCDPAELVAAADSVSVCLSKGLCAPVGTVIVSSSDFIDRAQRIRKLVGGGMRQVGVLAAAGLIALNEMSTRLGEDHANARRLAEGLAALPHIEIDLDHVQTNIVFFRLAEGAPLGVDELVERLARHRVLISPAGSGRMRAVTHYWIKPHHIDQALAALAEELS